MPKKYSKSWKAKATHLVLLALKDGPKHGYQITKHVELITNGYFSIGFSSLYPTLHSLEKDGLILGFWESQGAKEKKVYKLTDKGEMGVVKVSDEFSGFVSAFGLLLNGVSDV